jgi:hemerythrin-like domain-containing protein/uncharacterized protein (DUF2249 family)
MPMTLPAAAVVDITTAATAPSDVLAAFDALEPGEAILLRTVARPDDALRALRRSRAGTFEWSPLVEGPGHWEVEVHRLDGRVGALRGVRDALSWDHGRLDGLEQAAAEAWTAGQARAAARFQLRFVDGLQRHIRFEESVLFPEFERVTRTSPDAGPTGVMRLEHRMIEEKLALIRDAALRGVPPAKAVRAELRELLEAHDAKEEHVLYPMLDRALERREADAIVYAFQAMDPAE